MIILRQEQEDLIENIRNVIRKNKPPFNILLRAATGFGKTVVAAKIIEGFYKNDIKTLFLVHRDFLATQAREQFKSCGVQSGIIRGGNSYNGGLYNTDIGMIQTIASRINKGYDFKRYRAIVVDECHHSPSESYKTIINHINPKYNIGLTATPVRQDNLGLGDVYSHKVEAKSEKWLMNNKRLSPYKHYIDKKAALLWEEIVIKGNDYSQDDYSQKIKNMKPKILINFIEQYKKNCNGKRALFFTYSIEASKEACEAFNKAGISAIHVDANSSTSQREEMKEGLRKNTIKIVCNVSLITEGFDLPDVEACILDRRTLSLALYMQMIGRCLRFKEGKTAIILDLANNFSIHGSIIQEREYLHQSKLLKIKDKTVVCQNCLHRQVKNKNKKCVKCQFSLLEVKVKKKENIKRNVFEVKNDMEIVCGQE